MKKTNSVILKLALCVGILTFAFLCSACGTHSYREGLDNYDVKSAHYVSTNDIIPNGFLEEFEYVNGNFYYSFDEPFPFTHTIESTLIYLNYDDSVYENAKDYILTAYGIDDKTDWIIGSCKNYSFHINNEYKYTQITPHSRFVALSYNDDINTLVLIGFYSNDDLYEFENNQIVGFEDLLKTYFTWYDFES